MKVSQGRHCDDVDGFGQNRTLAGQDGRGNLTTVTSFGEEKVTGMFSDSVLHSTARAGEERMWEGMSTDDIGVGGEDKRVNRLGNGATSSHHDHQSSRLNDIRH